MRWWRGSIGQDTVPHQGVGVIAHIRQRLSELAPHRIAGHKELDGVQALTCAQLDAGGVCARLCVQGHVLNPAVQVLQRRLAHL